MGASQEGMDEYDVDYGSELPYQVGTNAGHGSASAWLGAALTAPPEVGAFKFAAQAAGIAMATALNFLLHLTWTFRIERSRGDDAADGPRGHQGGAD